MRKLIVGKIVLAVVVIMSVQACTSSRYAMDKDAGPVSGFDASKVPDAIPRFEIITEAGNKSPYKVRGKTYHVMDSPVGFTQKGVASWYGLKFHGHKTSNGEVYSMYGMTAAHKTLPIPSYVKITNIDNGKTAVVRVNDRGPFHEGRIIDLSYAAANKLGYANKGTANVALEVITVANESHVGVDQKGDDLTVGQGYYIQVGAFSSLQSATQIKSKLQALIKQSVFVGTSDDGPIVHRVRIGPFLSREDAELVHRDFLQEEYPHSMIIIRFIAEQHSA